MNRDEEIKKLKMELDEKMACLTTARRNLEAMEDECMELRRNLEREMGSKEGRTCQECHHSRNNERGKTECRKKLRISPEGYMCHSPTEFTNPACDLFELAKYLREDEEES